MPVRGHGVCARRVVPHIDPMRGQFRRRGGLARQRGASRRASQLRWAFSCLAATSWLASSQAGHCSPFWLAPSSWAVWLGNHPFCLLDFSQTSVDWSFNSQGIRNKGMGSFLGEVLDPRGSRQRHVHHGFGEPKRLGVLAGNQLIRKDTC